MIFLEEIHLNQKEDEEEKIIHSSCFGSRQFFVDFPI